jgi:hypothetical protein
MRSLKLTSACVAAALLFGCAHVSRDEFVLQVAGYKGTRLCLVSEDVRFRKNERKNGRNFCYNVDSTLGTQFRRGDCVKAWVPSPGKLPDTTARSIEKLDRACDIDAGEFAELADALLNGSASP